MPTVQKIVLVLATGGVLLGSLCAAAQGDRGLSMPGDGSGSSAAQNTSLENLEIHVVTVDSITGKPVPRVLLTSPDRRMAALTDSEGRATCTLLRAVHLDAAGSTSDGPRGLSMIQLTVRKPGYVTNMPSIRIPNDGTDGPVPTVQIKIVPASIIIGHVYPESGNLPEHTFVLLRHRQILDGSSVWTSAGGAQVNSRGEFRIPDLQAGDYRLTTVAHIPTPSDETPGNDSTRGLLPVSYPEGSGFIHLNPGETFTADLAPRIGNFYTVTIPVAGWGGSGSLGAVLLPDDPGLILSPDARDKSVHARLPDGSYTVRISSFPPNAASATVHVEVSGAPVHMAPVTLVPGFTLPVLVRRDFTSNRLRPAAGGAPVFITLQPVDGSSTFAGSNGQRNTQTPDEVQVQNVTPGTYRVNAFGPGGYVAAISSGATDLLQSPLVVTSSGVAPINVTLRDDFGSLSGRVEGSDTQAGAGQMIFLMAIPLDRPQGGAINGTVRQDDSFGLQMVPPGHYLLLASRQPLLQSVEFHNPQAVAELTSKGVLVTVNPGDNAQIQVPVMRDQPSAGGS